jgi:TMEM175 potassium channel family protein
MTAATLLSKHRLEAFADGIYAIAATLLVLELKLPAVHGDTDIALKEALLALTPKLLLWLLSFWVMALFWLAQQRALKYLTALDGAGVRIELIQAALISLLPFTTALIGEHGNRTLAAAIYSANIGLVALLGLFRLLHIKRITQLHAHDYDSAAIRVLVIRTSVVLASATLAFGISFFVPGMNMVAMLPALLTSLIVRAITPRTKKTETHTPGHPSSSN